ncbi:MAG: BTAD domain-containing putative transcriptional regulator [Reyranellaceae bacterium]
MAADGASVSVADQVLELSVLGAFSGRYRGGELKVDSPKARAILAYLALDAGSEQSRERLAGLLWSESGEANARGSLRHIILKLRRAFDEIGCGALRTKHSALALDHEAVRIDSHDVLAAAEAGSVHHLLLSETRISERLLVGFEELDPAFGGWIQARRQAFHDALRRALEALLEKTQPEDAARRRDAARALLQLDPTHESACRVLMQMYAEAGDPSGALRVYEKLWNVLDEDFDIEPSAKTQALVADIKVGRIVPRPAAQAASPPVATIAIPAASPRQSTLRVALFVEPFAINGVAPEQAHLVHGFRHDLIARLVRFREWYVLDNAPPEAGDGRVRSCYRIGATAYQAGNRISMVLTLADRDSGIFVWSERVDLTLDAWFETQQHVLRRIAIALNTHVSSDRLSRVVAQPDVSLEGYDSWLRCRHMLLGFNPDDWERAFTMAQEMAQGMPNFAPTWCNLAQLDNVAHIIQPGVWRDRARETRALEHARRAVQLDPTDCRNQLCLGWSYAMMGRFGPADIHMSLALELNPDDSMLLMSLALYRAFLGQHEQARLLGEQSLQATLVPSRTHWGFEVTNAYLRGDDEAALHACDHAEDVILTLQAWRAAALHRLGRQAEAERAAARFCEMVAKAWHSELPPTPAQMVLWLLHLYPFRHTQEWERLRDGVAGAGLPTQGAILAARQQSAD